MFADTPGSVVEMAKQFLDSWVFLFQEHFFTSNIFKMKKLIVNTTLFLALLSLISCEKQLDKNANPQEIASAFNALTNNGINPENIDVNNVDQLYAAVNDPANAGAQIILAAGTYALSNAYQNLGRLELQENMSLRGQPGQPGTVVIDASALPAASFAVPSGRTGSIRMGRGTNNIEWVTLKGSAAGLSVVDTDLPSTETQIRIAHVIIDGNGSSIGVDIRNREAGRMVFAELEHNDIFGNTSLLGPGIEVQNANPATGGIIKVNSKENYLHGNKVGLGAFNNGGQGPVNNNLIEITSRADRIEENGVGMYFGGGVSQVPAALASGNTTIVNAFGTSIRNNNPVPLPAHLRPEVIGFSPCGIYMVGGRSSHILGNNKSSNNTLSVSFSGCTIANNNSPEILAFGAWCQPQAVLAGTNNLIEIYFKGVSKQATVTAFPSMPEEPAASNVVNVFR
jgi:hypothetical protein